MGLLWRTPANWHPSWKPEWLLVQHTWLTLLEPEHCPPAGPHADHHRRALRRSGPRPDSGLRHTALLPSREADVWPWLSAPSQPHRKGGSCGKRAREAGRAEPSRACGPCAVLCRRPRGPGGFPPETTPSLTSLSRAPGQQRTPRELLAASIRVLGVRPTVARTGTLWHPSYISARLLPSNESRLTGL